MANCARCNREIFRYRLIPGEGDVGYCCLKSTGDRKLSTFPFTSRHITGDGRRVEVQSLRHLRRLETEFGVQSAAYNLSGEELENFRGR